MDVRATPVLVGSGVIELRVGQKANYVVFQLCIFKVVSKAKYSHRVSLFNFTCTVLDSRDSTRPSGTPGVDAPSRGRRAGDIIAMLV